MLYSIFVLSGLCESQKKRYLLSPYRKSDGKIMLKGNFSPYCSIFEKEVI
jgi:hypothetical protein